MRNLWIIFLKSHEKNNGSKDEITLTEERKTRDETGFGLPGSIACVDWTGPGGSAYALAIDNSGDEETLLVSNAQGIWKRNVPLAPIGSIWLPTIERQEGKPI